MRKSLGARRRDAGGEAAWAQYKKNLLFESPSRNFVKQNYDWVEFKFFLIVLRSA